MCSNVRTRLQNNDTLMRRLSIIYFTLLTTYCKQSRTPSPASVMKVHWWKLSIAGSWGCRKSLGNELWIMKAFEQLASFVARYVPGDGWDDEREILYVYNVWEKEFKIMSSRFVRFCFMETKYCTKCFEKGTVFCRGIVTIWFRSYFEWDEYSTRK